MSQYQQTQIDRIRGGHIEGAIDTYRELARVAQEGERAARKALIQIGEAFAPNAIESQKKAGSDLEEMPPDRILQIILPELQRMKLVAEKSDVLPERVQALTTELTALKESLAEKKKGLATAEDRNRQLEARVVALENEKQQLQAQVATMASEIKAGKVTQAAQGQRPADGSDGKAQARTIIAAEDLQEWMKDWRRKRTYQREARLITLLGRTGLCKSSELAQAFREQFGMKTTTFYNALEGAVRLGLANSREETLATGGRPATIILLTEMGRGVYRLTEEKEPVASEYHALIKAHKGPEHAALIMRAAKAFEQLGFTVDRNPPRVQANDAERFMYPDVVAAYADDRYYIEVEVGNRSKKSNEAKWRNAAEVGLGHIWLVTDTKKAMEHHVSEIVYWAGKHAVAVSIHATTIDHLKNARERDAVWLKEKAYRPAD